MKDETMKKEINKVIELLRKENIYEYVYDELGMIAIEVEWGDWKHEHLHLDWIMKENGYTKMFDRITEEDGSDTYSAIHYFAW